MTEKIKFIMSKLWWFLAPFIRQLMTGAGMLLADAAMMAVSSVQTSMSGADGAQKRQKAFDQIKTELSLNGIQLAANVINAAIETAVLKLKANP